MKRSTSPSEIWELNGTKVVNGFKITKLQAREDFIESFIQ